MKLTPLSFFKDAPDVFHLTDEIVERPHFDDLPKAVVERTLKDAGIQGHEVMNMESRHGGSGLFKIWMFKCVHCGLDLEVCLMKDFTAGHGTKHTKPKVRQGWKIQGYMFLEDCAKNTRPKPVPEPTGRINAMRGPEQ